MHLGNDDIADPVTLDDQQLANVLVRAGSHIRATGQTPRGDFAMDELCREAAGRLRRPITWGAGWTYYLTAFLAGGIGAVVAGLAR